MQAGSGPVPAWRESSGALVRDRGLALAWLSDGHRRAQPPLTAHRHVHGARISRVHPRHCGRRLGHFSTIAQKCRYVNANRTSRPASQ